MEESARKFNPLSNEATLTIPKLKISNNLIPETRDGFGSHGRVETLHPALHFAGSILSANSRRTCRRRLRRSIDRWKSSWAWARPARSPW